MLYHIKMKQFEYRIYYGITAISWYRSYCHIISSYFSTFATVDFIKLHAQLIRRQNEEECRGMGRGEGRGGRRSVYRSTPWQYLSCGTSPHIHNIHVRCLSLIDCCPVSSLIHVCRVIKIDCRTPSSSIRADVDTEDCAHLTRFFCNMNSD